jgi:prevent-host-death family protein
MKNLTATEAARRFSQVLDRVEHDGESFVVSRKGKPVARIAPAPSANGAAARDMLLRLEPDAVWARDLRELRARLTIEERGWDG